MDDEETAVLKLGLRYGLATRPNQLEIRYIPDKIKNSLRSFTCNYIDLDLKEFRLDRKKIRILNELTTNYSILKPDNFNDFNSNLIVLMKRSDYSNSVKSFFSDNNKFKKVMLDSTPTRLSSLQHYLSTLLKRGEISKNEYNTLRPKAANFWSGTRSSYSICHSS